MTSHLAPVWFRVTDLEVVSGRGSTVTTADGTEYLDFSSGIAVTSTGHCHPHVVEAIQRQAERFVHAQVNVYRHPLLEELAGEYHGKVKIMKINVDDHQTYASQFGVRSIPNLLVFKNGKVADQIIGAVPKSKLAQALDNVATA